MRKILTLYNISTTILIAHVKLTTNEETTYLLN